MWEWHGEVGWYEVSRQIGCREIGSTGFPGSVDFDNLIERGTDCAKAWSVVFGLSLQFRQSLLLVPCPVPLGLVPGAGVCPGRKSSLFTT